MNQFTMTVWIELIILWVFLVSTIPSCAAQCAAVRACLATNETCKVLPVPKRAQLTLTSAGESIKNLRPGVWVHTDTVTLSLIIFKNRHLVLIDQPESRGVKNSDSIIARVAEILNGQIPRRVDIVYSHAHFDHIGSSRKVIQWLRRKYRKAPLRIFGTEDIKALITNSERKRAEWPTNFITKKHTLILDNSLRIDISIMGGHSGKDLLIYMPRSGIHEGVVMLVDIVYPKWSPFAHFAVVKDLGAYINVHDKILELDFGFYIGGHLQVGDRKDVSESLRYVQSIVQAAKNSLTTVTPEVQAQFGLNNYFTPNTTEYGNIWFLALSVGRELASRVCAREVIRKWGCKLGGVAVTAYEHCFTALTYLFLES